MSKNFILIELVERPHSVGDEYDISEALSKLLTTFGVGHKVNVLSAGEIALQFKDDLPEDLDEGRAV